MRFKMLMIYDTGIYLKKTLIANNDKEEKRNGQSNNPKPALLEVNWVNK